MRLKPIFLALILTGPVAIIAFLYLFGENKYQIKGNKVVGKPMPNLMSLIGAAGGPTLVALSGDTTLRVLQERVTNRVRRIRKENGTLDFILVSAQSPPPTLPEGKVVFATVAAQKAVLAQDLGFAPDSGHLGCWYVLIDSKGNALNAYDLSRLNQLDTLAIEATIATSGQH